MQLAGQSRDDRDHVAFARTMVPRRTDFIGLPRHRSDYKNSIRRRFAVDQTAGYGHSASSPAKPASGACSDPPPAFQARRILRRSLDEGFAFKPHDSHDREPSGVLSSATERHDLGGLRLRSPGPARRRSQWDPRCAAEALTPPDGIRSRSLPYWRGEAKTIASAYILRGRGPSVEGD